MRPSLSARAFEACRPTRSNTSLPGKKIYTVGYATKPLATLLAQLHRHGINAVADVRSVPYSKAFREYHREALQASLRAAGIHYVWLGDELGPRSKDPAHYNAHGQVQFDRLMTSALFRQGIERLQQGLARGYTIALLCAEKDPAVCHRSLLIGHYLAHEQGMDPAHIHHEGGLESQYELEKRLRELHGTGDDLFAGAEEQVQRAWQAQCRAYAYRQPETSDTVKSS